VGTLEAFAAAFLWGSSGIFSVALFRTGMRPDAVAFWRPLTGTLFLALAALLVHRPALRLPRAGWLPVLVWGGSVTALFQIAYQFATEAMGVPATVGMLYLAPVIVMALSGPLLGERPGALQVVLGVVAVAGVWLVVAGARGAELTLNARGVAWGLANAAGYAGYTLFGRWAVPRFGSLPTVLHSYWAACLILAVVLPAVSGSGVFALPAGGEGWLLLLGYGLLTIAVAVFVFYDALRRIPAHRAAVVATVEPVVAALLAAILLGQHLTPVGWLGLALVVCGVAGAALRRGERAPATRSGAGAFSSPPEGPS
jgi:DME family drug/metabolite transporter